MGGVEPALKLYSGGSRRRVGLISPLAKLDLTVISSWLLGSVSSDLFAAISSVGTGYYTKLRPICGHAD